MQAVLDAIEVFFENLAAVNPGPLLLGVLCHLCKVAAVTRAWRNVVAAAYPSENVQWRSVFGAYAAGVAVNALVPVRGGDFVRLYVLKHRLQHASYATLASTLLVPMIFDFAIALTLFLWALQQGVLPSLDILPTLPSFEFSWFATHSSVTGIILVAFLVGFVVFGTWISSHVVAFRERVAQGFAIFRPKRNYFRHVVPWQALDWTLRVTAIYFFLRAFGVEANVHNALLAQVATGLSTVLPISPGGIGTEQALLTYVLQGEAPTSTLISFSVGMKLTVLTVNIALGFGALVLILRTTKWRSLLRRSKEAAAESN